MQPRTIYIHLTDSALFVAGKGIGENADMEISHYEISPSTPFAAVLNDAVAKQDVMQAGTDRVRVIVDSPTMLVPMAEFSEENFREYYAYCIPSDSERHIFCDPLPAANAMLVFSVTENIFRTLCDKFENVYFCSSMTSMAGYFIKKSIPGGTPRRMLIVARESAVDIIAVEAGRLLSANTFEVGAVSDIIYYTLGSASKLGFTTDSDTFYVAGETKTKENTVAELSKFAINVCAVNPAEEFGGHMDDTAEKVPFSMLAAFAEP